MSHAHLRILFHMAFQLREFKPTKQHGKYEYGFKSPYHRLRISSILRSVYIYVIFLKILSSSLCSVPVCGTSRGHAPSVKRRCRSLQFRPPNLDLPLAWLFNACEYMNGSDMRFEAWTITDGTLL